MMQPAFSLVDLIFYIVAAGIVASSSYAVFSGNISRAVFSLLGTFFGVAILYGFLAADFIAIIQVMIYVGGILVLLLFAVMLTGNIELAAKTNRSGGMIVGCLVGVSLLIFLITLFIKVPWEINTGSDYLPTTAAIGNVLLGKALLPFEALSVVLLAVVIGAVVIVRRGSENDEKKDEVH
jgi:NADH:ubiquinone oxidoreductase subunit 6 (subunit J)